MSENLDDMSRQRESFNLLLERLTQYSKELKKFFGDFLVESTYHISEQNYNLEITQTDDSSHLEPLTPLDTFAEFYFSKLPNETRSFLKGEYRHFLELLKTLQKVISEVPDVVPYFTHDNIFLDKDGHIKIISAKFYKKDDHSVKESKEKIQEVIEFIENTMLPLLRTV